MSKHPHEYVLRAIAEGKRVQYNTNVGIHSGWIDMGVRAENNPINSPEWSWRVPDEPQPIIYIGNVAVPEPLRSAPPDGTTYYAVCPDRVDQCEWQGSMYDYGIMESGFAHVEKESAELHRAALVVLNSQVGQSEQIKLLSA